MKAKENKLSRQRLWQIKKEELGLCCICAKPAVPNRERCESCLEKARIRNNAKYHNNPKHRERMRELVKVWHSEHPGKMAEYNLIYLAKNSSVEKLQSLIEKHTQRIERLKRALEIKSEIKS